MAKPHLPMRLRELIGIEETLWLVLGLAFGYLAGKGAPFFIIAIPVAVFLVWLFDWLFGCPADHPTKRPGRR